MVGATILSFCLFQTVTGRESRPWGGQVSAQPAAQSVQHDAEDLPIAAAARIRRRQGYVTVMGHSARLATCSLIPLPPATFPFEVFRT